MTNPLSGELSLDVSQFRSNITKINREMRLVTSRFQASAAAIGDWSNDATGMEKRVGSLTEKIGLQGLKVEQLTKAYEAEVAASGKSSAAAKNLEIRLNKEQATLGKMNNELDEATERLSELEKEQKGAERGAKSFTGGLKKMVTGIKSIGPAVGGAVGGLGRLAASAAKATARVAVGAAKMAGAVALAMGALAASTIGPASDLNETLSKVEVVFGNSADAVKAFGSESAEALGMSQNAALGAAATYGNLLTAMGLSESASADMSMELVELAADLASFNNMDPTEVLDKLRAGLTGETEPLKALGVNMNQTRIAAKALELGLVETTASTYEIKKAQLDAEKAQDNYNKTIAQYGSDSLQARDAALKLEKANENLEEATAGTAEQLSAAAKAQAAYAIMMEDTTKAQGDFARTSDGLANQQRILQANLEDVKSTIGQGLLPVVTELVDGFNQFIKSDFAQSGIAKITEFLGSLSEGIQGFVNGEGFGDLDIGEMIGNLLSKGLENKTAFISMGLDIITSLLDGIVEALPNLITGALQILTKLVTFIQEQLPALIEVAIPLLMTLLDGILNALPVLAEGAIAIIIALALGIADALPTLIPTIVEVVLQIVQVLLDNLPLIIDAAIQIISALIEGLILALPDLIAYLPSIVKAIYDVINPNALVNLGWDLIQGLWQGIKNAGPEFFAKLKSFFSDLVANAKKALQSNSPSILFAREVGEPIPQGIGVGMENALPALKRKMSGALAGLADVNMPVNANFGRAGAGLAAAGSGGMQVVFEKGAIQVDARGSTNPELVGQKTQNGVLSALRAKGM
jgi:phage-related protein